MQKTSYSRVTAKNRRKIQEAFAELLAERGSVRNITVTDLADRAEITRGTFYNYYDNLYEVGTEIQSEIEQQFFSAYDNLDTTESINQYVDEVFVFLGKQEEIYRELLASDVLNGFLGQLENGMSQRVLAAVRKNGIDDKKLELELLFTINGAIAIVRKYYRHETVVSLDEIRDYLKSKLCQIFEEFANNKA